MNRNSTECVLRVGETDLIVKFTFHPERGGYPPHYEVIRVELAGEGRDLKPLLDELDVLAFIEAKLSLKELK